MNSTLTERDRCTLRRIVSKNHRTTAAQVRAELNIHLEDPVSTEVSFTNPTSTAGLQLIHFGLLTVMLRCINDCVTTIKPGHETTGNARVMWSDESSFTLLPSSGRVYVWRTPKEAHNPECLGSTVKHGGSSVMVRVAISWYSILSVLSLPFKAE
jgi:hypothetical protein